MGTDVIRSEAEARLEDSRLWWQDCFLSGQISFPSGGKCDGWSGRTLHASTRSLHQGFGYESAGVRKAVQGKQGGSKLLMP